MRQVPYLIIGSGRMATHMQRYFDLLHLSYLTWSRKKNTSSELHLLAQQSERVLLLIKDDVIANFIAEYGFLKDKILIHFSGNLLLEGVYSAHPLMTFIPEAYDLATYQIIPYILEENAPDFNQLLPGLPNHSYRIANQLRSYYHAMCVVSGNFTVLLWDKFFSELKERFKLPAEIAYPYLSQIKHNLINHFDASLTGPLIRGDKNTIQAHLDALSEDDFKVIYQAFVDVYVKRGKQNEYK